MVRVHLQNRLADRHLLSSGFEQPFQVHAHARRIGDQARGRVREPMRDAHFLDLVAKRLRDLLGEIPELIGLLLLLLLLGLVLKLAEVEVSFRHRSELLVFELHEVRQHPFVDAVGQQQDFHAFLAEDLQVRAVLGRSVGFAGGVVDLVLAFFHARHIIGERHGLILALLVSRGEAQ